MRYFDCHSHFSTKAGLHHATPEDYEQAQRVFKRKRTFETEEQMAEGFRSRNVRTILDIYRTWRMTDEDEIRASNDYATDFALKNKDIVFGNWLAINPTMKDFWLKEFRRLADKKPGFLGFCQSQNSLGFPPSDPVWDPFYKLAIEVGAPVLLMTGLTGIGQGLPGGKGIILEDGHPRHVDRVAARYPELKNSRRTPGLAVAGRHARDPVAQGQCAIRSAWLVTEIFHPSAEEGDRRPPAGSHPVRLGLADADA